MAETPPGIHLENVGRFFRERLPEFEGPLRFELIAGGRSNLTYRVRGRNAECVLRRPPLGHVLPTAHDMAREFRVLSALADSDVPVARPLALCSEVSVNEMPFYVMEYRPGVVLDAELPPGFADTPRARRLLATTLIEILVRLHAVDVEAVGLGDFGRPAGYLARQLRRWSQQWERSRTGPLPALDEIRRRLEAALPETRLATLVHGDYRLGNLAWDPADPGRIRAVFDWEMATLGDPLADLGYTLIYWGEAGDPRPRSHSEEIGRLTAQPGFPSRDDLVQEYARRSGRSVSAIDFYVVLALYKLAVISEGIFARHRMGKTVGEGFDQIRRDAEPLAERALAVAGASSLSALRGA